ncbi:MAG: DUF1501 domain-containing protein [Pirellulaceae bacterium]
MAVSSHHALTSLPQISVRDPRAPTRRAFLGAACGWWTGCLSYGQLVAARSEHPAARPKSVILIFNCGGPSHIDLWDPKPQAPDNVRSIFAPIATNVPGIEVTELLPRLAQRADKLAIVRSVHHRHSSHNSGMHWSIVGRPYRIDSTLINPSRTDYPSFGTLVGWLAQRDGFSQRVPPYVITPAPHCDSLVYLTPGQFGGCLGRKYDPFVLNSDPNAANFRVPNVGLTEGLTSDRLQQRTSLLANLESRTAPWETESMRELAVFQEQSLDLTLSDEMRRAFDLSLEPAKVREAYGRNSWGQSHLLARRLVEAGTRFVTTVNGPSITWDTHQDNFNRHRNRLVPPMEQAFVALLDDLSERGLLDSTLVVWMGDFGRTPIINKDVGRDHWPQCYSMVLAGGGIRGGQVVGSSDKIGARPATRPVAPADVHATVFQALGYDPRGITYYTVDGRPTLLSEGEPLRELL